MVGTQYRSSVTGQLSTLGEYLLQSMEAKSQYWLTTADVAALEFFTPSYHGFGMGRAPKYFKAADVKKCAVEKWGAEKLAQKEAARRKRWENKRKREEAAEEAAQAELDAMPAPKRQKLEAKEKKQREAAAERCRLNGRLPQHKNWTLTVQAPTQPARFVGVVCGTMTYSDSFMGDISFSRPGPTLFGNFHGMAKNCTDESKVVHIETVWKVCGQRKSGWVKMTVSEDSEGTPTIKGSFRSGVREAGSPGVVHFSGIPTSMV